MIKIGDWIRTTYGIGKVAQISVQYTDDGHLWHLNVTTDYFANKNGFIEIGLYPEQKLIKTTGSGSRKIVPLDTCIEKDYILSFYKNLEKCEHVCYIRHHMDSNSASLYDDHEFIAVENNLIDLIQLGDIVNKKEVREIHEIFHENTGKTERRLRFSGGDDAILWEDEIESIITKEQFEMHAYSVKNNLEIGE